MRVLIVISTLAALLAACELPTEYPDEVNSAPLPNDARTDPVRDIPRDNGISQLVYRFVRIDDVSESGHSLDAGADIDAIILTKVTGERVFAETIESFTHGGSFGDMVDPTQALGFPDAFDLYPDVSQCNVGGDSISLGGIGGQLIVQMGAAIERGDTLTVLEVGNCEFDDGMMAIQDDVEVFVSVARDDSRDWVSLGAGGVSPEITFEVPALPFEPVQ